MRIYVISSAVGIEAHNRNKTGYKPDVTLKNVYVLTSVFKDGEHFIPVKLEVKEFNDKSNTLYVAVSLDKIKETEVSKQGTTENGVAQNSRSVNISIRDIFKNVNPLDVDFLKYIPDGFLNEEQVAAKRESLSQDNNDVNTSIRGNSGNDTPAREKAENNDSLTEDTRDQIGEKFGELKQKLIDRFGKEKAKEVIDFAVKTSKDSSTMTKELSGENVNPMILFNPVLEAMTVETNEQAKSILDAGFNKAFRNVVDSRKVKTDVKKFAYDEVASEREKMYGAEEASATAENSKNVSASEKAQPKTRNQAVEDIARSISDDKRIDDSIIDYTNSTTDGTRVNWNDLSESQQRGVAFIKKVAEKFNLKLKLISNGVALGMNGAYVAENDAVIVDVYAGIEGFENIGDTIITTTSHEMTHWMKNKARALYEKIDSLVFKALEKNDGKPRDERIRDEMKRKGYKTEDEARDEIIARACEDMLSRSKFGQSIYNELTKPEKKTFRQVIKDVIAKMSGGVQSVLSEYKSNSKEARILRKLESELNEISDVWNEALEQIASETDVSQETMAKENTATDDGVRRADRSEKNNPDNAETERRETIEYIRSLGRISVNEFTSENIRRLEKFARRYGNMGTKSPFFRAWFGDWREKDKTKISYVEVNSDFIERSDIPTGDFYNNDTEWTIKTNYVVKDETSSKKKKWSQDFRALKDAEQMLSSAILLDTVTVSEPSERMGKSAIFVHHLYCPVKIEGTNQKGIAKLYVTETYEGTKRFYLNKIEMSPDTMGATETNGAPWSNSSASDDTISVAEIFDFVKSHDSDYEKDSRHEIVNTL